MFKYSVVFYPPYDDGSHPFGDWKLRFYTPESAFAYAEAEIQKDWEERRAGFLPHELEWFDNHVQKNTYVVEVHKVAENDNN
jgi:hypothetical protein